VPSAEVGATRAKARQNVAAEPPTAEPPTAEPPTAEPPTAETAEAKPASGPPSVETPLGGITPGTGSDALDKLRSLWPEIVAQISQNPPAKPLIAACRPISVEGNVVTLGFPEGQAFLKDALERRRPMLEEGISKFLGRTVAVRCVATNLDLVPPVAGDADAEYVLAEARRIFGEDLVDVGEVS
jgi:hypothetical protein